MIGLSNDDITILNKSSDNCKLLLSSHFFIPEDKVAELKKTVPARKSIRPIDESIGKCVCQLKWSIQ